MKHRFRRNTTVRAFTGSARRLADVLQAAGISAKVVGYDTTHEGLNDAIGAPNDPLTKDVFADALKR
jgi:hypothetical protein